MNNELHRCAESGNLERVKQLVERGANIDATDSRGRTALFRARREGHFEIVVYLVEHGANVAHTDSDGMTTLHDACINGNLSLVKYLLDHGSKITERDHEGMTALLYAASGNLKVLKYLLSPEGGASISETNDEGNTALSVAAGCSGFDCHPEIVQWLLEYGGAQITDTYNAGDSVWTVDSSNNSLRDILFDAYEMNGDGEYISIDGEYVPTEYIDTDGTTAMLRVMVLHGGPPESLTAKLAPPLQRIVQDGARLRARLPAYLTQRRTLLDAHCPLLPQLWDLVQSYEELWATGLEAPL
jgi:ankyrin repeat protein